MINFRLIDIFFPKYLSIYIRHIHKIEVSIYMLLPIFSLLAVARAQGKCPTELSQPKARRKTWFDTALFSTMEDYQRYKQYFVQRRVILGRNINFPQLQYFRFEGLFTMMGWLFALTISESVFPTLVWAFYSRATYDIGGPVTSTVRGVEIRLHLKSICHNFDIAPV